MEFLVTVILAILIFAPACYVSAKFLRTSEQAKDNFVEFAQGLGDFAQKGLPGEKKSQLLIMDQGTAIVYFEKGQQEVLVEVDAAAPYTDYKIHLQKPAQCADEKKNCLCLFREAEFDTTYWKPGYDTVTVKPVTVLCANINFNLEAETCNLGQPHGVNSYRCSNGFMIERHLAEASSWAVSSYYDQPRRSLVYLQKIDQAVRIIPEPAAPEEKNSAK